ncbi:MAG: class I SAM-dependent DNA methyltransferase, partial [Bacteroidia bacterium]|nr:class I SAM-dependent DNA methyltransferase [Bacteroidia bacterium]
GEIRQPESDFILIPRHSSENRKYIPFGFFTKNFIVSDSCFAIPKTTLFHFGILSSEMHMAWVRSVCGRLESRFRYSKDIVYNNFPWPQDIPKQKVQGVEKLAEQILKVRMRYPDSSLADLYDPLTMPTDLVRAHQDLDKFIDSCYRPLPFSSEAKRMEFLFELYEKYTADLFTKEKVKRTKKKLV